MSAPHPNPNPNQIRLSALIFVIFTCGGYLIGCGKETISTGAGEVMLALATKINLYSIINPSPSAVPTTVTLPPQISCGTHVYSLSGSIDVIGGVYPSPSPSRADVTITANIDVEGPGFTADSNSTDNAFGITYGSTGSSTNENKGMYCAITATYTYNPRTYLLTAPSPVSAGYECIVNGEKVTYKEFTQTFNQSGDCTN